MSSAPDTAKHDPAGVAAPEVALRADAVFKRFGATQALRDASIDVRAGEVHALVGENGSGKSTLVKIISGVHAPDSGRLLVAGEEHASFRTPRHAQRSGIATVFQEVLTAENRTVLENLWLGSDGLFRGRVPAAERRQRAQAMLAELLDDPPPLDIEVAALALSDRQACAIARALLREPRVLVLDEATSALDFSTRTRLFAIVRRLSAEGVGVVLITHRMDEIHEIADRITVLRTGVTVGTVAGDSWTVPQLVTMMTGSDHLIPTAQRAERPSDAPPGEVVLETRGLTLTETSAPIDVSFRAGELVGLAGLEGHGQDAFVKALWGLPAAGGAVVRIDGEAEHPVTSPDVADRRDIAYIPRERRGEALFEWMSILDNFAVPTIGRDAPAGLVRPKRTLARFREYSAKLSVRHSQPDDAITTLSGGNQQKVIVARWLAASPRILLLNDPTRGIDINAKRDLYALLGELADEGVTVVMVSSEVDEHVELMDRVLVFRENDLAREFTREDISRDALVASFFGEVD